MSSDDVNVTRKVYFFKVAHFYEVKEALLGACIRIKNLEFNDNGRYRLDGSANNRYSLYPDTDAYPLRLRFGKIRRDALPQVEHEGNLETLALQEDAGLVDISHIIIFEDGFVASEWNVDGPKISQLTPYFMEKGGLNDPPRFLSLVERDIVQIVSSLNSVRILEIDIPPDAAELAREADDGLYEAIKAAEAMGATKRVGLKLTSENGTGKLKKLAQKLAEIISSRPQERDRFHTIQASGYDGSSRVSRFIDILESKMVSSEMFTKTSARARSIDSDDAYRVINRSYIENLPRLKSSASSADL